ncbi:MAG: glycosyltransferase family 2 protein [Victivallales bacterium]|nr:glycosyltransferase family 2 protein [Victivallales bacterium]
MSLIVNPPASAPAPEASGLKLSVIIPVYNEEKTVLEVISRVRNCGVKNLEIIVVNDCSTDGTKQRLATVEGTEGLRILEHSHNQGKGAAIRTAQAAVTGDVVIIQDADLEYDPAEFPRLIRPLEENKADAVYGSRYSSNEALVDGFWHYYGNKLLTFASNLFSNLHLTDMETCYKMIRAELFKPMLLECNRFGFEPEVTAKLAKSHCRIFEMPITYIPRTYGEGKKIGIGDAVAAFWYIFKYNVLQ